MPVNGLMIDCARLIERHAYYTELIDFMADWEMNLLVLHFTDDHGCAVKLPGFPRLASPHALPAARLKQLIARATERNIEVIPELETFGHTRYLTDQEDFAHLAATRQKRDTLVFNAVDPLRPETLKVMEKLMQATCKAFPGRALHLGCDEVDLSDYCGLRGLDPQTTWAEYVNRMIDLCHRCGREPMLWGDHPERDPALAALLRKDVAIVHWNYEETVQDAATRAFVAARFKEVYTAPSVACYRHRFLPPASALKNVRRMAGFAQRNHIDGMINTVWCPFRYIQGAMYYGIAYGAEAVRKGGLVEAEAFHERFARQVFDTDLDEGLARFLDLWPQLAIDHTAARELVAPRPRFSTDQKTALHRVNELARTALAASQGYAPRRGRAIWDAMVLAARAAGLCSEAVLLRTERKGVTKARKADYNRERLAVRKALLADWDATRFADDPARQKPRFSNEEHAYAVHLIGALPKV